MFGESLLITKTVQRRPAKWVTFAASLFIHFFFIAALIITPLVDADAEMPGLTIEHIFLSAPPPPALPPPPTGGSGQAGQVRSQTAATETPRPTRAIMSDRPIVPVTVPDKIPEEQLTFFGNPQDGPGIVGAPKGWNEGEEIPGMKQVLGTETDNGEPLKTIRRFDVKAPRLMQRKAPDYPPTAMRARIQGTVIIEADTDVYGKVTRTKIISGHPLLVNAALDAVRQWLYEPYIINGIPRPVNFIVEVKFTLTM